MNLENMEDANMEIEKKDMTDQKQDEINIPSFLNPNEQVKSDADKQVDKNVMLDPPFAKLVNDISLFGFSQQGKSHVKFDMPCQDRVGYRVLDHIIMAAIADGVGSCKNSDFGARCAIDASLNYMEKQMKEVIHNPYFVFDDNKYMKSLLADAMQCAYEEVKMKAIAFEDPESLKSTLTIALYDGQVLFFAHAGDDGIVALNKYGTYMMVTQRHKGEEASSVYPLQSKSTWQFGKVIDVVGFVMATDGVLDGFVMSEYEKNRVYFPFLNNALYCEIHNEEDVIKVCKDWYAFMESDDYRKRISDDLSIVSIVNQKAIEDSVKPYFDVAHWNKVTDTYNQRRQAILYHHDVINDRENDKDRTYDKVIESGKEEVKVLQDDHKDIKKEPTQDKKEEDKITFISAVEKEKPIEIANDVMPEKQLKKTVKAPSNHSISSKIANIRNRNGYFQHIFYEFVNYFFVNDEHDE